MIIISRLLLQTWIAKIRSRIIFDRMIKGEPEYYMTRMTHQRLQTLVNQLVKNLDETGTQIGESGGTSDFHDNFAFEQAHRDFEMLLRQRIVLEDRIKNVIFIEPNHSKKCIGIGHEVEAKAIPTNELKEYTIVGPLDSDPMGGLISFLTPVAIALIGKIRGDIVQFPSESGPEDNIILDFRPGKF